MKRKKTWKKILIAAVAAVLVCAIALGVWAYFGRGGGEAVSVYAFLNVGMTDYWGDSKESYGPITTDRIQTVYLSNTQTVTEVLVNVGDSVKKGDVLMTYDTTLSDLALEKKRLEVEKLKLQLSDAEDRLWEINNMVPMVIPTYEPEPDPTDPDLGEPLSTAYRIVSKAESDGSTPEKAIVCWLRSDTGIDATLLTALREQAQKLQEAAAKAAAAAEGTQPAAPETETTEPSAATEATAATAATETTAATDPTEPPATDPTEPPATDPTEPVFPQITAFYAVFKVTEGDMSLGGVTTWQGLCVSCEEGYPFRFFDASGVEDPMAEDVQTPEEPEINIGSGFTASQIAQMRSEQERTIKDLEFNIKMTEADYKIMQTEVSDGNVVAEFDGTVVSLLPEEEAKITSQPMLKVSGGGGFYVTGSVGELDRDALQIGQEVTVTDWNMGMTYTGTVQSIGDYPAEDGNYYGGNPNVSYYPFTVFIDGEADMMEGYYAGIEYSAAESEHGIYLEKPFLRTENGRSYVYVRNDAGLIEKRYVTTGKSLWGSYTEILSGLSESDYIAFPYGKTVREGAQAVEADISELYNY